jgi:hypothetical protein
MPLIIGFENASLGAQRRRHGKGGGGGGGRVCDVGCRGTQLGCS